MCRSMSSKGNWREYHQKNNTKIRLFIENSKSSNINKIARKNTVDMSEGHCILKVSKRGQRHKFDPHKQQPSILRRL